MESDPDLKHAIALTDAFTAFLAGEMTFDELAGEVGEIRQAKLARLLAHQDPHKRPVETDQK